MKPKHIALVVFSLCYFYMISFANPLRQYEAKIRLSVLVLLGEWFGDTYFPLKEEINRRGWIMKRIGVDTEYRGCYNKARDVVLTSDILIPDFKDFSGFDCLIIPSGPQWRKFNQNPLVLKFLKDAHAAGLLIVSFCVGNTTVQAAGLFDPSSEEKLFPDTVKLVREGILLGPRGGGPPPGDGFKSAPIKEICDGIFSFHKNKKNSQTFTKLKGPYLGQKPPGMKPEIFAPGIISTGYTESYAFFSPDGKELYYMLWGGPYNVILHMREGEDGWIKPQIASFFKKYDEKFCLSPDGKTIVFGSHRHRPFEGEERHKKKAATWILKKTETGWSEAQRLRDSINGPIYISGYGHLYFSTPFNKGLGGDDIFFSRYIKGEYEEPENMGHSINTSLDECDPCIAPDESYLIFCRRGEGFGRHDLFISFRKKDGAWTKARNMGDKINTNSSELCPNLSPDGKYLFFTSNRRLYKPYSEIPLTYEEKLKILNSPGNGSGDIYWVDAKIIEELKPKELK